MNMTREESPGPAESYTTQREALVQEVDRRTVVAEAKVLVKQLDVYLDLLGTWAAEGWEDEDAGH